MNSKTNLMTSLAVCKKLYDENKTVYDILYNFIITIVIEKNIKVFNSSDMKNYLNDIYGFKIPESIIRTSLKRRKYFTLNNYKYNVDNHILEDIIKKENIDSINTNYKKINNKVIEDICLYVENLTKDKINREQIIDSFCDILLNNKTNIKFYNEINACIISNENNDDFIRPINYIKEGLIFYRGITSSIDINSLRNWKEKITIYCDISVLFNFAGYNGSLYKELFDDFFNLVKEINNNSLNKNKNKVIYIEYFEETMNQIEDYFKSAEEIVKNNTVGNDIAMEFIIKDCLNPSDVLEKKAEFYRLLDRNGITKTEKIEKKYIDEKNYQYFKDFDIAFNEINPNEIANNKNKIYSKILQNINILRKGNSKEKFEKIRHIFLTSNNKILSVANDKRIKEYNDIPLAIDLDFITNIFWFKLNKGLGKTYPINIDIVVQSRKAISATLLNKISKEYDRIVEEYNNLEDNENELKENIKYKIATLKSNMLTPELIKPDNINTIFNLITNDDLENIYRENDFKNNKIKQLESLTENLNYKNLSLSNELEKKTEKLNHYENIEKEKEIKKNKIKKILKCLITSLKYIALTSILFLIINCIRKDKIIIDILISNVISIILTILKKWLFKDFKFISKLFK